jgi:hypothetical protein
MLGIAIFGFYNFSYASKDKHSVKASRATKAQQLKKISNLQTSSSSATNALLAIATQNSTQESLIDSQPSYNAQRERNIYDESTNLFKLSRSKLENFKKCKRCFYLDRKKGVSFDPGFPFSLNNAVDDKAKKEFDTYRELGQPHPQCLVDCNGNKVNAIPFKHPDLAKWRNALYQGIEYTLPGTNIVIHGGIDDIWINLETGELIIVDYKATSKKGEVTLDAAWQNGYKRQVEIYQWLFRKNGFKVSNTAYFVYYNAKTDDGTSSNQLNFVTKLIPYVGDDSWVEKRAYAAYRCLKKDRIPAITKKSCRFCQTYLTIQQHEQAEKERFQAIDQILHGNNQANNQNNECNEDNNKA